MTSIYSIYKATNTINGKVYIGFDSNWPKRKQRHLSDSSNEKSKGFNDVFHKAIRKYGKENFDWQIIYQSKDSKHCLKSMEEYFIKENNSYIYFNNSNGYNMTLGGEGMLGFKHSEKSKIKNSVSSGKNFKVWHKDGELIEENHIKYFCVKNNLDYDSFKKLLHNKLFSYKGYYPYNNENNIAEALKKYNQRIKKSMEIMGSKHSKEHNIKTPSGEIIKIKNLSQFCRDNNMDHKKLRYTLLKTCNYYPGWEYI